MAFNEKHGISSSKNTGKIRLVIFYIFPLRHRTPLLLKIKFEAAFSLDSQQLQVTTWGECLILKRQVSAEYPLELRGYIQASMQSNLLSVGLRRGCSLPLGTSLPLWPAAGSEARPASRRTLPPRHSLSCSTQCRTSESLLPSLAFWII